MIIGNTIKALIFLCIRAISVLSRSTIFLVSGNLRIFQLAFFKNNFNGSDSSSCAATLKSLSTDLNPLGNSLVLSLLSVVNNLVIRLFKIPLSVFGNS